MKLRLLGIICAVVALSQIAAGSSLRKKLFHHKHTANGKLCAFIVAGSNGWYNYRHQADVAHAFHVLKNHGVKDEDIVTMMYDDIAYNRQNPFPGKLYNGPDGKDVYQGIKIDYRGESVTPKNFLAVLKGDKDAIKGGNGRVLDCGENDRVFIYFTDHGGVGLIAFPEGVVTTKELNEALNYMHENKKFGELVFYLEACESGSMFENVLSTNKKIYAITAANGHESSWGTYCENKWHLPCLGDLFSVNWLYDSDEEELTKETLQYQYELVKRKTNQSHVMQFGDLNIAKEPVANFQGEPAVRNHKWRIGTVRKELFDELDEESSEEEVENVSWSSRDVKLNYLKVQLARTNDRLKSEVLSTQVEDIKDERREIKKIYFDLVAELADTKEEAVELVNKRTAVLNLDCHHKLVHLFHNECISLSKYDYALKYVYILNNLCTYYGEEEKELLTDVRAYCNKLDN